MRKAMPSKWLSQKADKYKYGPIFLAANSSEKKVQICNVIKQAEKIQHLCTSGRRFRTHRMRSSLLYEARWTFFVNSHGDIYCHDHSCNEVTNLHCNKTKISRKERLTVSILRFYNFMLGTAVASFVYIKAEHGDTLLATKR
jgi:hypothetical protein